MVPTPFAVGPANVYVLLGDRPALFDCGPNTPATERALLAGLSRIGVRPEDIGTVVVSHGHPDHYGMAPRLQSLSGCRVMAGRHDVPKLGDRSMLVAAGRLLLEAGMPMETLLGMGRREGSMGNLRPTVENVEPLDDGERLDLGRFDLEVLHLPGHTAGHVCLWHEPTGVLLSGDTLLLDISPNPLLEPDPRHPAQRRRSLIEYLATLDRLSAMPLSTVHPGHGPTIEHPTEVIERMRSHHARRVEQLGGMVDGGGKSGWQLAAELFPHLEGFDNFLAVSEVLAHMDLLVEQRRAEAFERGGVTLYRRPQGLQAEDPGGGGTGGGEVSGLGGGSASRAAWAASR